MKVLMKTRNLGSVDDLTAELDVLAQAYGIQGYFYDESAAEVMSEFDSLRWITLCAQRAALRQREFETIGRDCGFPEVPSRFLGIYETKQSAEPVPLENTEESLSEIAA
jgi:hypothetical protein